MKEELTMLNWLKKYCKYITIYKSCSADELVKFGTVKEVEKYSTFDYLPDQCSPHDFLIGERVQAQIKILIKLHEEGLI